MRAGKTSSPLWYMKTTAPSIVEPAPRSHDGRFGRDARGGGGVGKGDTKALSERVAAMPAFAPGGRLEGSGRVQRVLSQVRGVSFQDCRAGGFAIASSRLRVAWPRSLADHDL